jgi:hypothetical protein
VKSVAKTALGVGALLALGAASYTAYDSPGALGFPQPAVAPEQYMPPQPPPDRLPADSSAWPVHSYDWLNKHMKYTKRSGKVWIQRSSGTQEKPLPEDAVLFDAQGAAISFVEILSNPGDKKSKIIEVFYKDANGIMRQTKFEAAAPLAQKRPVTPDFTLSPEEAAQKPRKPAAAAQKPRKQ